MENKIAFIADIHSNLTALETVIKDIEKKGIKEIICLGDIIGKGPRPYECLKLVKNKCQEVIIGNLEVSIIELEKGIHGEWNREKIGKENIEYIQTLKLNGEKIIEGKKIYYTHSFSADGYMSDVQRITEKDSIPNIKCDILIYADIHHQYVKEQNGILVLNTGSVGNPLLNEYNQIKNEKLKAEYLVLNISKEKVDYEFCQVEYDKQKEIEYLEKVDMPHKEKYILEIEKGRYIQL